MTDYFKRLGAEEYDRRANAALGNPEGEVLDLFGGDAKEERSLLRKVVGVAALVLAIGMLLASLGCASVPECDELQMYVMQSPGGRIYMLDERGLANLAARQKALQAGTCRLPGLE